MLPPPLAHKEKEKEIVISHHFQNIRSQDRVFQMNMKGIIM